MTPEDAILALVAERLESLPPMPHTVAEVMQMSRAEECSAADLAEVVCKDPALAARVLKLCNSGFYGLRGDVTSIQRAVLLVGFEMTKNLVLSSFVHSVIEGDQGAYAQTAESLWEHSFGAATACLALAEKAAPDLTDVAYTAGLIHDIGKVALASLLAERFQEVVERVRSRGQPFVEAEREVLGTGHPEVGALVAERWGLPPALREVIRHHHDPGARTSNPRLAALVRLGDAVCSIMGIGAGLDGTDARMDPADLEALGLDGDRLQAVLDEVVKRILDVRSLAMA